MRVHVSADGTVQEISVVRGLSHGLTEQAIAAARQTKFKPAMKDGKPVPYWLTCRIGVHYSLRISNAALRGEEWTARYRLSPGERCCESEKLWQICFDLAGSL